MLGTDAADRRELTHRVTGSGLGRHAAQIIPPSTFPFSPGPFPSVMLIYKTPLILTLLNEVSSVLLWN